MTARETVPDPGRHQREVPHVGAGGEHVLVVGGGRIGRELARNFPNVTILESDPAKVERIKQEMPQAHVEHGSGSNPDHLAAAGLTDHRIVILVTNSDDTNYKCARVIRRLAPDVFALAHLLDDANEPRFHALRVEPVVAPIPTAAGQIANILEPGRRNLVECVLTEASPVAGRLVSELPLDSHTTLISVLRDEHLIPPSYDLKLEAGDVLTVITTHDKTEVLEKLSGREGGIDPLSRLYVPLLDERSLTTSFREAFVLAMQTEATIYVVCRHDANHLAEEARRLAQLQKVRVHTHLVDGDAVAALRGIVRQYDEKHAAHRRVQGLVFDGIVVPRDPLPRLWERPFFRSTAEAVIEQVPDHPVLVAASPKPYRSILLLVDAGAKNRVKVAYAIDLALTYGSRIVALTRAGRETKETHNLLQYLKRTGRVYGVEVEERELRGNPALEIVLEVRQGDHNLVILDWESSMLQKDFVKRIIRRAPQSVLVVP